MSYFRLIKAYSIGLKKKNDKYNQGITFDMIKELYLFNCNFRQALFAQIYGVKYTYLESWIEHIAFVRNICAHYGRLYNVNLSKTPALYKQYTKLGISSVRVFAILVCLSNILPKDSVTGLELSLPVN